MYLPVGPLPNSRIGTERRGWAVQRLRAGSLCWEQERGMGGVSLCTSLCEDRTRQQSSPCSRAHLRAHRVLCRQQHGPFPSHPLLHCLLKGRRTAVSPETGLKLAWPQVHPPCASRQAGNRWVRKRGDQVLKAIQGQANQSWTKALGIVHLRSNCHHTNSPQSFFSKKPSESPG